MTSAPVGRPEKYTTHVLPHLDTIKTWRENGMKLESIADKLGITHASLCNYQKEYIELFEALSTAKEKLHANMLITAEDSVLTILKDRTVEETSIDEFVDAEGNITGTKISKKTRVIPANATAVIFTLKNRDPDNWRDRTEVDATVLHGVIPQPLAPVRQQDILEGEIVEVDSDDETD